MTNKLLQKLLLTVSIVLSLFSFAFSQQITDGVHSIVPAPLYAKAVSGNFELNTKTRVFFGTGNIDLEAIAKQLANEIHKITGFQLEVSQLISDNAKNAIVLKMEVDTLGDEGYRLSVGTNRIMVKASKPNGIFYATQSIIQLIPIDLSGKHVHIPNIEIIDKPRFGWRGLMLDVGRYFYSVDYIKKYIDYLAMHKLNSFHWHLTESHGWRIEIKKYPRLTSVGAWRAGTQFGNGDQVSKTPHGGYYTQEQAKEIVAYARSKYITVIPEIEMPGHSYAALVAYPELSCTGKPTEMPVKWDGPTDIFCAGKEGTFHFLSDVLSEIAEIFPSELIHIGGDEANRSHWKVCSNCQKRIKDEGLKDEKELQSYFIRRIEKFLATKGKRIIGWDEILEGGIAPNATVMSWRGIKGGIEAAKMRHQVVMSPAWYMYFDYYQGDPSLEPYSIGGFLRLRKVYDYEPIPTELSTDEAKFILGVQGNLWTEFIHSTDYVEYMTFPRAAALSEIAWSAAKHKNWEDFTRRMETQYQRYGKANINYSRSAYDVAFKIEQVVPDTRAKITLSAEVYQPDIRYTIDGTEPSSNSLKYESSIQVSIPSTIKAATFKSGKRISKVSAYSVIKEQKK